MPQLTLKADKQIVIKMNKLDDLNSNKIGAGERSICGRGGRE